jgi:hypothetical protein
VTLQELQNAIRVGRVKVSDHADEEASADRVRVEEVFESVLGGEILEEYQDDRPYPSCLVLDISKDEPVHSVWAYNSKTGWAVLVTVYRPTPDRWIDWRTRKPR